MLAHSDLDRVCVDLTAQRAQPPRAPGEHCEKGRQRLVATGLGDDFVEAWSSHSFAACSPRTSIRAAASEAASHSSTRRTWRNSTGS